jgi:hypothetical protein
MTKKDLVALADSVRMHNRTADGRDGVYSGPLQGASGLLCSAISQLQSGTLDRLHCRRVWG